MSRVYFHTQTQTAQIGGAERHYWGALCWRLTKAIINIEDPYPGDTDRWRELVKPGHYLVGASPELKCDEQQWARRFLTALHVGDEDLLQRNGHAIESFGMILNTALAVGNDAVRLAARLHGQCEIHCWVAEENREWLASIIEQGIAGGVLRKDLPQSNHRGYDDVLRLLRHPEHRGPVVCSYSVCEQFPGVHLIERDPAACRTDEEWRAICYEMPENERWDRSFAALKGGGRELKPEDFGTFRFMHKISALDLVAHDRDERLDRAITEGRL